MTELKDRLRTDLTTAMKAQDKATTAALRMALAAVSNEEVAGEQARELTDDEVTRVLAREVKKRKEAAEAFAAAGRAEQAAVETREGEILAVYLPAQLSDDELAAIVDEAIAELGEPGPKQMGQVMKIANAKVAGRAEGGRVAAAVKSRLMS